MAIFSNDQFLRELQAELFESGLISRPRENPALIREGGAVHYCKIGDVGPFQLYFYCGPYLQVDTAWVGFGAPRRSTFSTLNKLHPVPVLTTEDYNDNDVLIAAARKTVQEHRFVYEDLVGRGLWKWFGSYMPTEKRNIAKAVGAVELLLEMAGAGGMSDRPPWIGETERYSYRKIRLAQEYFRQGQLDTWGGRCCVTGCGVKEILRASHIDGWADSPDRESRTSTSNGLLLVSTLDALFDRHLISFADDGTMLQSVVIKGQGIMGLHSNMKIKGGLTEARAARMQRHRAQFERRQAAYLRSRSAN